MNEMKYLMFTCFYGDQELLSECRFPTSYFILSQSTGKLWHPWFPNRASYGLTSGVISIAMDTTLAPTTMWTLSGGPERENKCFKC